MENGKKNYTTSYKIIEFGDAYIELLEECPCDSKMLLHKREGELIRSTECVNKCIPGRTSKEYDQDNKDKIAIRKKKYREDNKESIAVKTKKYEEKNKEKISTRRMQHYNNNKEMRTCVCGSEYNYGHISSRYKHYRTTRHIEFVENFYENFRELTCQ